MILPPYNQLFNCCTPSKTNKLVIRSLRSMQYGAFPSTKVPSEQPLEALKP